MCAIFLKHGDELIEMVEQPYEAEDILQQLLADYPNLLVGEQDTRRRRWLLVKRELGVASAEDAPNRWSLDHLFLDEEGVPTLVEVKRSSDTRLRREVVGQMLDYAANGAELWGPEQLRAAFESRYHEPEEAIATLAEFLGAEGDPERFWEQVGVNLRAGRLRLVFVADVIPVELRSVVEFLNEQMERTEVLALEVRQYREIGGDRVTLVPRLIGSTQAARQTKRVSSSRPTGGWTDADLFAAMRERNQPAVAERMIELCEWFREQGARESGGAGKRGPSVAFWLGEATNNPVSLVIHPDKVVIAFGELTDKRSDAELARFARLVREIPGVSSYIEDLEDAKYHRWKDMRAEQVLGSAEALEAWKHALAEATRAA